MASLNMSLVITHDWPMFFRRKHCWKPRILSSSACKEKKKKKKINKTEKAECQCASMPSWWLENQNYLSGLISSKTQMCLASHRSLTDMGLAIHTLQTTKRAVAYIQQYFEQGITAGLKDFGSEFWKRNKPAELMPSSKWGMYLLSHLQLLIDQNLQLVNILISDITYFSFMYLFIWIA